MKTKLLFGALVAICWLGCAEKKSEAPEAGEAAGEPNSASEAVASSGGAAEPEIAMVAASDRSKHFATVAGRLDLGGAVFAYVDIDGDVERFADGLTEITRLGLELGGDELPPELANFEMRKLAELLGFASVDAVGISSYESGGRFRNKVFLHTPLGRKGVLKMLGRNAAPFAATSLAPADADLIYERDVNLAVAYKMLQEFANMIGGEAMEREFVQSMGESFLNLGVSVGQFLGKFDSKLLLVVRTDSDERLRLPGAPLDFPATDVLIAFDNVKWLVDVLLNEVPPDVQPQIQQGEGFKRLQFPPMLPGELQRYQPVFHFDENTGRLLVATRVEWLDECLSGESKITDKPDFAKAMEGLPEEGNGLSYSSPRFMSELRKLVLTAMEISGQPEGIVEINRKVYAKLLPDLEHGVAGVSVNYPDGILWASNSNTSPKEISSMGAVTFLAVAASISVPVYATIQKKARMNRDLQIMKMIALAMRSYAGDSGGNYPDSLDEILPDIDQPASFLEFYDEDMGESARVLHVKGLTDSSPAHLPLLIHPFVINGKRAVIYCDGRGEFVDADAFRMPANLAE